MPTDPRVPERVAHRGVPRERTENTLEGFLLALERGADAIELDVHTTVDGEVIVHHDFEAQGYRIDSTPAAVLEALHLAGGARIPRLAKVLRAVGEAAVVYVELKGNAIEDKVVPVLREFGHRFAVHSFDHASIARCARKHPAIPRGVLIDRGVQRPIDVLQTAIRAAEPRDVWPHYSLVNAPFMEAAAKHGVRVIPWTVNDAAVATRLTALGVAAICSDDVRILAGA